MYAQHFGLRELPFNNTPDPRFFFSTPDHEEALACLVYAVSQRKGYAVLTGEVGAGKTTVGRMMLRRFDNRIVSAVINNTYLGADDLLLAICTEFNLNVAAEASRIQLIRTLQDYLLAEFAADRPVVLVLDEAQNLSLEAFEQLRMIGNLEADDAKLLQMIILGQPELRHRFDAPNMRQLKQRVFRSFHLPALSAELCSQYIRHRLKVASDGASPPTASRTGLFQSSEIFDDEAVGAIHAFTHGLPRLINTVCDNCLLSAFGDDRRTIDGPFARRVIEQISGGDEPKECQAPLSQTGSYREPDSSGYQAVIRALEPRLRALELRVERISSTAAAATAGAGMPNAGIHERDRGVAHGYASADRATQPIIADERPMIRQAPHSPTAMVNEAVTAGPRISQQLAPAVERLRRIVERSRTGLQLVQTMGAGSHAATATTTFGETNLDASAAGNHNTDAEPGDGLDGDLGELQRLVEQAVR